MSEGSGGLEGVEIGGNLMALGACIAGRASVVGWDSCVFSWYENAGQ